MLSCLPVKCGSVASFGFSSIFVLFFSVPRVVCYFMFSNLSFRFFLILSKFSF